MDWTYGEHPAWDGNKGSISGSAPAGCFPVYGPVIGGSLPYKWWRLEADSGETAGYGWLVDRDQEGVAEISICVSAGARGTGYGTEILRNLEKEAKELGYRFVMGVIQPENPSGKNVIRWLLRNGYQPEGLSLENALGAAGKISVTMVKSLIGPGTSAPQ